MGGVVARASGWGRALPRVRVDTTTQKPVRQCVMNSVLGVGAWGLESGPWGSGLCRAVCHGHRVLGDSGFGFGGWDLGMQDTRRGLGFRGLGLRLGFF